MIEAEYFVTGTILKVDGKPALVITGEIWCDEEFFKVLNIRRKAYAKYRPVLAVTKDQFQRILRSIQYEV